MRRYLSFLLMVATLTGCPPKTVPPLESTTTTTAATEATPMPVLASLTARGPSCGYWVVTQTNTERSLALVVRTTQELAGPEPETEQTQIFDLARGGGLRVDLLQGYDVTGMTCTDIPSPTVEVRRKWTAIAGTVTAVMTGAEPDVPVFSVQLTLEGVRMVDESGVSLELPPTTITGGVGWYPG